MHSHCRIPCVRKMGALKESLSIVTDLMLCYCICRFVQLLDTDECASRPCKNGGSCIDRVNKYNCSCAIGYAGINCETGRLCLKKGSKLNYEI